MPHTTRSIRRALMPLAAVLLVMPTAVAAAAASGTGGGVQRWTSSYRYGSPAFSQAVALTPDGSTVFVTGGTLSGPSGHMATLAYDASTGAQRWIAEYPLSSSTEFGRGNALAVSPDGSTLFVTGWIECPGCSAPSFEGFATVAYDVSTGDRLWVARYAVQDGSATSIAVSPDGSRLFVNGQTRGGEGSATLAYDPSTGQQMWVMLGNQRPPYGDALSVSPDSSTLFVAATARVPVGESCREDSAGYRTAAYNASDGTLQWSATFQLASDNLCGTATSLGMSPDGSTVFVTGYGGSRASSGIFGSGTVAYDALTGTQRWATRDDRISTLDGDVVISLGVSPDGSKVFVLGNDCAAYPKCGFATLAYDTSTGDRQWVSRYDGGGAGGYALDLAVSPRGSSVFITGQWDTPCTAPCNTGMQLDAPLVAYDGETGDVQWATTYSNNVGWALAASPDGSSVYLAGTFTASSSTSATATTEQHLTGISSSRSCSTTECGYSTARYNTGPGPGTFQDPEPSLRYNGWRNFFHKTAVGSAYRASNVRGDTAAFKTPKSTSVTWLTRRGPNQGKAKVRIDGHVKGRFNLYDSTASAHSITFKGLALRAHTVKVTVLGRKGASSRGTWVAVDGFQAKARGAITHESSTRVHYDSWTGVSNSAASGGSYRMSGSRSARMSFDFTGRAIRWITATGPAYGRARVMIDGKAHRVDLYRRSRHWRVAIAYTGLSRGKHHVTVRPLGTKNASSRSKNVVVDAFVVRS